MKQIDRSSFLALPHSISINHCGVSPMVREGLEAAHTVLLSQAEFGSAGLSPGVRGRELFRHSSAELLETSPDNISFIPNSAFGLNLIAHGFAFERGDEIISYRYEYPSNHYPWKMQTSRGVNLKLVEGSTHKGSPFKWDLAELESLITPRTRMVAVSHVQFTSGFAVDLAALSDLCRAHKIYLVVDAAQSIGCMPVYPEKLGIDAVVTSGWKWLLGPLGSGVMYTSPDFRAQLRDVIVGPDMMTQGSDYLNHTFSPVATGGRFEYSTQPASVIAALGAAIATVANRYGIEEIWRRVQHLHRVIIAGVDPGLISLVPLEERERSGILAFTAEGDPQRIVSYLESKGIRASARGPTGGIQYLRCAPHFYLGDVDAMRVVAAINEAASTFSVGGLPLSLSM